jgi:DNA primase
MTVIELIVAKINIVDYISDIVELHRESNIYKGKCPMPNHGDTNASLAVYPETQSFYCFGCGAGGTVINFVQHYEQISYNMAIEKLADIANIDLKNNKDFQKQKSAFVRNNELVKKFKSNIKECEQYLIKERGLTPEIIEEFALGWNSEEKAIVIPIRDHNGRVVAFSRRFLYSEPKYKNSRNSDIYDKSKLLFNFDKSRRLIKDRLYIVEGYFDAISGYQAGQPTVAYCSSELTRDHILAIKEFINVNPNVTIYLCPDNDKVGQEKLIKMREKFNLLTPRANIRVVRLPEGIKDFNEYISNGGNILELENEGLDMYVLEMKLNICDTLDAEYFVAEDFFKTITSNMVKAEICIMLSQRWTQKSGHEVSVKEIKDWLDVSFSTDDDILCEFKGIEQCLNEFKEMLESDTITLGFSLIDSSIKGLRKSDVLIFGAYSSVGKTWYSIEFTKHMVIRLKMNLIIFSLEMTAGAFMERIIANVLKVSTNELLERVKSSDKWLDVYATIKAKLSSKIKIIDKNNISIGDIDRRIKIANARIWDEGQTDAIVIDYFQYMKGTQDFEGASNTARSLKACAKENNIVIICLSQLNRGGKPWEKPSMLALKGTGDLESSADFILMAWRPGDDPSLTLLEKGNLENTILLYIAKSRRGALVTDFEHYFNKETTEIQEVEIIS